MITRSRNEAAVREETIAPLLKALGYQSNTANDIRYELSLRYPKDYLGRKKGDKDPDLRGKADYVCVAGGRVGWTVEAKPEVPGITQEDIEQAYTYARHPEVRAVYFCLCNGLEFRVYSTDASPDTPPLRTVDPSESGFAARALESLLGPDALIARFAVSAADSLPSIGPGLNSFAQIVSGRIVYDDSCEIPVMRGFTVVVTGGAIQREENGGLYAYWEALAPYSSIQRTLESLGLTRVKAFSKAAALSADTSSPTVFETDMSAVFPKGHSMRNLQTHEDIELPFDLRVNVQAFASGVLSGDRFSGPYRLRCLYTFDDAEGVTRGTEIVANGIFEFSLR